MRRKSISHFLTTRITFYILFFLLSLYVAVVKQIVSFLVWIGLKKQLFLFCCAMQLSKTTKVPYDFLINLDISKDFRRFKFNINQPYLLYIFSIIIEIYTHMYPRLLCKHFRINLQILGFLLSVCRHGFTETITTVSACIFSCLSFVVLPPQVSLSPEQMVCFQF